MIIVDIFLHLHFTYISEETIWCNILLYCLALEILSLYFHCQSVTSSDCSVILNVTWSIEMWELCPAVIAYVCLIVCLVHSLSLCMCVLVWVCVCVFEHVYNAILTWQSANFDWLIAFFLSFFLGKQF